MHILSSEINGYLVAGGTLSVALLTVFSTLEFMVTQFLIHIIKSIFGEFEMIFTELGLGGLNFSSQFILSWNTFFVGCALIIVSLLLIDGLIHVSKLL